MSTDPVFGVPDISLLILLVLIHALADYPVQGDFLPHGKRRASSFEVLSWRGVLTYHAAIHAGAVFVLTESLLLGLSEFVIHWMTDYLKFRDRIGRSTDQAIHIGCKVIWWILCIGNLV